MSYLKMIEYMDKHNFVFRLPKLEDLDNNPFNRVLCLGILTSNPNVRHSYTSELFSLIIHRGNITESNYAHLPQAIKLIKQYYDFKILLDIDHSRPQYSDKIALLKKNVLQDTIIILNHYTPKNTDLLRYVDYVLDYSPKFLIQRKIIPKIYESKLRAVDFATVVNFPDQIISNDILKSKYILTGGKTRRDYKELALACNSLKVNLVLCDPNIDDIDIPETKYIKKIKTDPQMFNVLIENSLFVVIPAKNNVASPVGITVIAKSFILGKVCISTINSDIDEFISDGYNGFIVENTKSAYEKAISFLLNDANRFKLEQNVDRIRYTNEGAKLRISSFISSLL